MMWKWVFGIIMFLSAAVVVFEANGWYMLTIKRKKNNSIVQLTRFADGRRTKDAGGVWICKCLCGRWRRWLEAAEGGGGDRRPGDLDSAITDRIDDVIDFPLPQEEERFKLLKLYLHKYLYEEDDQKKSKWHSLFNKKTQKIVVKDLSDDVIREAAKKTEGFPDEEDDRVGWYVSDGVVCFVGSQRFGKNEKN